MEQYFLYVDGGGTKTSPCYFSYSCYKKVTKLVKVPEVQLSRFLVSNLAPQFLPIGCQTRDEYGFRTNNIAEYCACYYGLFEFQKFFGGKEVNIFQDSQLVVNQVNGIWACEKPHLTPWCQAIQNIKHNRVFLQWVKRETIINVLGH